MRTMQTTVSARNPLISQPTEMQNAYNDLAVAIKRSIEQPTPENIKAVENALAETYRVEDLYREGRKLLLARAADQRDRTRRPS